MYNLKILKYPTGFQYRVYSRPVGYCDNEIQDDGYRLRMIVDDDGNKETLFYNPKTAWINPFNGKLEREPIKYIDDEEWKKERSVKNSMSRTINKVYHIARSNVWQYFVTLTFNPEKVDSFDYEECTKKLSKWLNNLRRDAPDLKYIVVPEQHKSGRWHFHGLFADVGALYFEYSGKDTADGQRIYNLGNYKLGFSTATIINDNSKVTKYISKYITKELCKVSEGKKRYWCSRNLQECEVEELLLPHSELEKITWELKEQALFYHTVEGAEVSTTYLEMAVNENDSATVN